MEIEENEINYQEKNTTASPEIINNGEMTLPKKWYQKWWGILINILGGLIIVTVMLFAGQVYYYYRQIKSGKMPVSGFTQSNGGSAAATKVDPEKLSPTGEPNSSPGAPLTIVGFFDFECPYSKQAYLTMKNMQLLYGEQINFVFRNFPLVEIHPNAMLAAQAGECAEEQNQFWSMHDKIFEGKDLAEQSLRNYTREINLNENTFISCLSDYRSKGNVLKDILDGQSLGVRGTPTWFIRGEKIEGTLSESAFKKIIDHFLPHN